MKKPAFSFFFAIVLLFSEGGLSAHHAVPMALPEITESADVIVDGLVQQLQTQKADRGDLYTRVTLRIEDIWASDREMGQNLDILLAGGTLGRRKEVVEPQATYAVGERVVVFLKRNSKGNLITVGLTHGKFKVISSKHSHQDLIWHPYLSELGALLADDSPLTPSLGKAASLMTLQGLKQRVQRLLR